MSNEDWSFGMNNIFRKFNILLPLLAAMLFGASASAADYCAPSELTDPQPLHINGAKSFVYKKIGDQELRLHVFSSSGRAPDAKSPAVVFFFGGGFIFGDIRRFQTQATHLALRGIVTVLVDYRVKCRHNSTPMDSVSDGKSAMRWVRSHADELDIDPSRIAAAGSSAGGVLALGTELFSAFDDPADPKVDPRPNALILYNPGIDSDSPSTRRFMVEELGFGEDTVARLHDMSPIAHLDHRLPPTIIFQGTADVLTPIPGTIEFCRRAKALKSQCQVVPYEGAPHGFTEIWMALEEPKLGLNTEIWATDTMKRTDRFLAALGWLPRK
jgi:acetyl esterase/lipase